MTAAKADVAAADRLLRAAVRRARAEIRYGREPIAAVVAMLTEAGNSAAILLNDGAS